MINVILTHDNHMVTVYMCIAANYSPYHDKLYLTMKKEYMRNNHLYVLDDNENNTCEDYSIDTKRMKSIKIDGQEILTHNFFEKAWLKIRDMAKRNRLWV